MIPSALLFPGQGAQCVGMGREFYESSPQAREVFDQADSIIKGLKDVIFNGPEDDLTSTKFCQPAIFTFSIAALAAFQAHPAYKKFSPQYACGLSLGEYSALTAAGALGFQETLKLVERRSAYMEEAAKLVKGTMSAVVGCDKEKILLICLETGAQVANFNSPEQTVITGKEACVQEASRRLGKAGAKRVIPLSVSGAFHSSLMQPAVGPFSQALEKLSLKVPTLSLLSNVDALPTRDPALIRKNLAKQITSAVQWVDSINAIAAQGVRQFFEIGPGTVLKGLVRKINPELSVINIQRPGDLEKLLKYSATQN